MIEKVILNFDDTMESCRLPEKLAFQKAYGDEKCINSTKNCLEAFQSKSVENREIVYDIIKLKCVLHTFRGMHFLFH